MYNIFRWDQFYSIDRYKLRIKSGLRRTGLKLDGFGSEITPKNTLNRPYLSSRVRQSGPHAKAYSSSVFQYFLKTVFGNRSQTLFPLKLPFRFLDFFFWVAQRAQISFPTCSHGPHHCKTWVQKVFWPCSSFFYFGLKAKNFGWNFVVANPSVALRATLTKLDLYPSKFDTHSSIRIQILNEISPQAKFCQNTALHYRFFGLPAVNWYSYEAVHGPLDPLSRLSPLPKGGGFI